jgi:hypothetical protein
MSITVAARSKAAARLLNGFESRCGNGCLSVASVVCWQVEVSATSCSLVQTSSTDRGASLCAVARVGPQRQKKTESFTHLPRVTHQTPYVTHHAGCW